MNGEKGKKSGLYLFSGLLFVWCVCVLYGAVRWMRLRNAAGADLDALLLSGFGSAVIAAVLLCLLVTAFLLYWYDPAPEKTFSLLALAVGMVYMVVITPLAIPDGPHHYQSAYQMSNRLLLQWDEEQLGDAEDFNYDGLAGHFNVSSAYLRLLKGDGPSQAPGEKVEIPQPRALGYWPEYVPQAVGLSIGRLLGLSFMPQFLLGRFTNLLFYAACVYFAVKRTPKFKMLLGTVSLFPMALHQAASYSTDSFINGMAFILIASLLKAVYGEGRLSRGDILWIILPGMLLAPTKLVYCPILLLAILIPWERFGGKKQKTAVLAGIFGAAAVFVLYFQLQAITQVTSVAAGTMVNLNWEGKPNYTLGFLFSHPVETVKIFLRTLLHFGTNWVFESVGGCLCGLSLSISKPVIFAFCLNALVLTLDQESVREGMPLFHRLTFGVAVCLVGGLTMLSMFVGWTSEGNSVITGVQGRYFIPVLPLAFMLLSNQILVLRRRVDKAGVLISVGLHVLVVMSILKYTIG